MSDPFAEEYCAKRTYSCGFKTPIVTAENKDLSFVVVESGLVTLSIGTTEIDIQTRNRDFKYTEKRASQYNPGTVLGTSFTNTAGQIYYVHCGNSLSGSMSSTFLELFETLDTEIFYMDLRNDTAAVREVYNKITFTDSDSTAPDKTTGIFTGYDTSPYFTYVFDGIPIEETVSYFLITKGEKTLLNKEVIGRGFPYLALIMPTFPVSAWGIRFSETWANETEWYRQDLRKTADLDGDELLFYPEWCSVLGKLNQTVDKQNASLKYTLNHHQPYGEEIKGNEGQPQIALADMFDGGMAFDPNGNMFYSIAVNTKYYNTKPDFLVKNKLVVDDIEVSVPIEKVRDRVMSGDPPKQETDVDGNLKWTDEKDSEYTCYYPIAPL